jgi:hypothetical protein
VPSLVGVPAADARSPGHLDEPPVELVGRVRGAVLVAEHIKDGMAAEIRKALTLYRSVAEPENVEIRPAPDRVVQLRSIAPTTSCWSTSMRTASRLHMHRYFACATVRPEKWSHSTSTVSNACGRTPRPLNSMPRLALGNDRKSRVIDGRDQFQPIRLAVRLGGVWRAKRLVKVGSSRSGPSRNAGSRPSPGCRDCAAWRVNSPQVCWRYRSCPAQGGGKPP